MSIHTQWKWQGMHFMRYLNFCFLDNHSISSCHYGLFKNWHLKRAQDFSLLIPQNFHKKSNYFTFKMCSGSRTLYSAKIKVSEHRGRSPIFGTFFPLPWTRLDKCQLANITRNTRKKKMLSIFLSGRIIVAGRNTLVSWGKMPVVIRQTKKYPGERAPNY